MRVPAPIYVLPLLIVGSLSLDCADKHLSPPSAEDHARSTELASTVQMGSIEEEFEGSSPAPRIAEAIEPSAISMDLGPSTSVQVGTSIHFELSRPGYARLTIFDARGRRVCQLAGEVFNRGSHECVWNGRTAEGRPVESGVYFARLESLGQVASLRIPRL